MDETVMPVHDNRPDTSEAMTLQISCAEFRDSSENSLGSCAAHSTETRDAVAFETAQTPDSEVERIG